MNKSINFLKVVKYLSNFKFTNQRDVSNITKVSLGKVNQLLKHYNNDVKSLSKKKVKKNAVILAAGNYITNNGSLSNPVGLVEINGEILIERLINQLIDAKIRKIFIIIGFQKQKFLYLKDKFNVELIINDDYLKYGNNFSLSLVINELKNSYIIPADIYLAENIFKYNEYYSWYGLIDDKKDSINLFNTKIKKHQYTDLYDRLTGIAFIHEYNSNDFISGYRSFFNNYLMINNHWETYIFINSLKFIYFEPIPSKIFTEINQSFVIYSSPFSNNELKLAISQGLKVKPNEINDIQSLKKGITNNSYTFKVLDQKYIIRIPGKGTNEFIDRSQEFKTYNIISQFGVSDNIVFFDEMSGIKISKFVSKSRVCDPKSQKDLKLCFNKLKYFHNLKLKSDYFFDFKNEINKYEKLFNGNSWFKDYFISKSKIFSLIDLVSKFKPEYYLTHIDAISDNFLIDNNNEVFLLDWEYSAMQDPLVDLAMFSLYSSFSLNQIDNLIKIYFESENIDRITKFKLYSYISICGLIWSNWCEYKIKLGVNFKDYSVNQYSLSQKFYSIAIDTLNGKN
jgi:CTP:phosphocholine cytidylyltransferase-like protein/thiamine kinase-like enzyme